MIFSQWKYICGNSWGVDKHGSTIYQCTGCGDTQEHFFGCADIAVRDHLIETTHRPTTPRVTTRYSDFNYYQDVCTRKLDFGSFLHFNDIIDKFCDNFCAYECLKLKDKVEQNFRNNVANEPSALITCLDTCPKLCDCS